MKNETKMQRSVKSRILAVIAMLLLGISILTSLVVFTDFMEHTIYEESTAHLTEIYHQANQTLYNKVSFNWGVMRMWAPYLESAQSDADVCSFLSQAKGEYHFTDFFFVSRDGSYVTLDGERGYLDLGRTLSQLILEQQPIVANSVVPDKPEIMVFAVPTEKGSYQGFDYEAIAITYNNRDLVDSLKISAFEGHGSTFAVLPDGRVVLDSSSADMSGVHNILALLKNSAGFTAEQVDALQDSFAAGEGGNLEFSINGVGYYMVYGSAAFQNWTILGIAPKSVVNANMNRLQYTTMAVMSGITGMLAFAALLLVGAEQPAKAAEKGPAAAGTRGVVLEPFPQCGRRVPDDRHRNQQGGIRQPQCPAHSGPLPRGGAGGSPRSIPCRRRQRCIAAGKSDADGTGRPAGMGM